MKSLNQYYLRTQAGRTEFVGKYNKVLLKYTVYIYI